MSWVNTQIAGMPRSNGFPFQVQMVYYCTNWVLSTNSPRVTLPEQIEFTFRLSSTLDICRDEINGVPLNVKFPHCLVKHPGDIVTPTERCARDAVSFRYQASIIPKLKELGLLPEKRCWEYDCTAVIENLFRNYYHCLYNLYSPGCPERLDWICFQLLREVIFQAEKLPQCSGESSVIKNISLWMEQHCCEDISIGELAGRCGMSRSAFYRAWQRYMDMSPLQYILNMRLETAVKMLLETPWPIARIAGDAHFCSVTEFYSKFKARYGISPAQFRKSAAAK